MKNKLYFINEDSEQCFPLEHHFKVAKEQGLQEITLFVAVVHKVKNMIYCKFLETVCDKAVCGRSCEGYNSSNKTRFSGLCLERGKLYTWGEKRTFKIINK